MASKNGFSFTNGRKFRFLLENRKVLFKCYGLSNMGFVSLREGSSLEIKWFCSNIMVDTVNSEIFARVLFS